MSNGIRSLERTASRSRSLVATVVLLSAIAGPSLAQSTPAVDALTEPGAQSQARYHALVLERARSKDLRVRILYSLSYAFTQSGDDGSVGVKTLENVSPATLFEQARGSTDPLTLTLLERRCSERVDRHDACDRLEIARRWTVADTQNQIAWLTLAGVLRERGDLDGARGTFRRAAGASGWHESYGDVARLLAAQESAASDPSRQLENLADALGKAAAGDGLRTMQILHNFCRDETLREPCGRIVQTMARDTETLLGLTLAVRFAVKARLDPFLVAAYQQKADAVRWTLSFYPTTNGTLDEVAQVRRLIDTGERRSAERIFAENHVTEAEAARRHVATLSSTELARRATLLAGDD